MNIKLEIVIAGSTVDVGVYKARLRIYDKATRNHGDVV